MEKSEQQQQKDQKTKLARSFSFWFQLKKANVQNQEEFENSMQVVCTFNTVEDFWGYYQHIVRPDKLPVNSIFYLFQEGIKPLWEDPANENGSRFQLRVKKEYSNRFWEDLILGFIGELYSENDLICGIIVMPREKEVLLRVWTKLINEKQKEDIMNWIRKSLGLSNKIQIDYEIHNTKATKIQRKNENIQQ